MVYGRYNYSIHRDYFMVYKPTYNHHWGGPSCICFLWFFPFEDHPFWMILWFRQLQWAEEWKYQRQADALMSPELWRIYSLLAGDLEVQGELQWMWEQTGWLMGICVYTHMLHGAGIFINICPNKITHM